jgi:hypothetical protein
VIALLLISDGRDEYRERTIASAQDALPTFDHFIEVKDPDHKLGFSGAIQEGWQRVRATDADYCFHLEADFTFNEQVPLDRMIEVLEEQDHLAQMALKRQPWNEVEKAAGGYVEADPDSFVQRTAHGDVWTEHRKFFTTNPCVYSTALCAQGWPQVKHSEGIFTHRLLEDPDVGFGLWGAKFDPPRVEHIGTERQGNGY